MLKILKKSTRNIFDVVLVFLLFFLSIKKGGFYKTDILFFSIGLQLISITNIIYSYIKNKEKMKFDVIGMALLFISLAYVVPIVFNNYSSLNDSITEFIRYFNMYLIYKNVAISNNKKIYKYCIIFLGIFLGILGIDGMGNRLCKSFLNLLNSGYLNIDLVRMSSTIQYANVLAIILLLSSLFILEDLNSAINKNNYKKIVLNYTLLFFSLFCLILTQSRTVMFIAIISFIFYSIIKRKKKIEEICIWLCLIIEILICSVFAFRILYVNPLYIYFITLIAILGSISISYLIVWICKRSENKIIKNIYNRSKIIAVCTISLFVIYIILACIISTPLNVTDRSKENIIRAVYNVDKIELNTIKFSVHENEVDSRYRINIYKVSKNNIKELIKTFEYYNSVSGNFQFQFNIDEDTKNIALEFNCYKGSISISDCMINNKKVILNYMLLPTDIIYKIKDAIYGADSVNTRIIYFKDAIKIWNLSYKNKIMGIGRRRI